MNCTGAVAVGRRQVVDRGPPPGPRACSRAVGARGCGVCSGQVDVGREFDHAHDLRVAQTPRTVRAGPLSGGRTSPLAKTTTRPTLAPSAPLRRLISGPQRDDDGLDRLKRLHEVHAEGKWRPRERRCRPARPATTTSSITTTRARPVAQPSPPGCTPKTRAGAHSLAERPRRPPHASISRASCCRGRGRSPQCFQRPCAGAPSRVRRSRPPLEQCLAPPGASWNSLACVRSSLRSVDAATTPIVLTSRCHRNAASWISRCMSRGPPRPTSRRSS